ncbi:MAG: alpha/beta hydrolase [Gammaproteobacteria bacterium]|nr:alpha/beta hydrolase [Gammaproteobacteria bacterium]
MKKNIFYPVLGIFILLALSACTGLFFYPQEHLRQTPARLGLAYRDVYFEAEDGVQLHGWWLPAPEEALGAVLFLHGNAENISTHLASVAWLPKAGFNVFLFDYRGYGRSQGEATLAGLHKDIEAALETITQKFASQPVILFGQSLGGSLAITALAASARRQQVCGLVTDSAFSSYRDLFREKLAGFWLTWPLQWPLSLTVNNAYQPLRAISEISPIPVLLMHGARDRVVPVHHARDLYAAAGPPRQLWIVPAKGHIQALRTEKNRRRLLRFLKKVADKG